jgi:hypothetical protein
VLEALEDWNQEAIHTALFELIAKLECKNGIILWPLRTALSGKQSTPGGGVELAYLLGKEELFVDGTEGIKGVYLMDSMLFSAFTDKKVPIPFDDDAYYAELQKRVATGRVKADTAGVVLDTANTYGGGGKK